MIARHVVIIRKPASPGMEHRQRVIVQSHLDMVPQKNLDKHHDFATDPIETIVDGDWVRARLKKVGIFGSVARNSAQGTLMMSWSNCLAARLT